jgi:serine/threonine-protein kinase
MSVTYLVFDYQTHGLAVLKEINSELARKAKARELFQREARSLQALRHPGIPRFHDFFFTDERYSLVMEMIHGQTLEKVRPKSPEEAVGWILEVCDVLNFIHNRNPPMIHRDIKPGNLIMRYHPRQIVLIDFGAVKDATSAPGTRIATPGYSALEQQRGIPCIQSDYYALGTTLLFLLTRQFPGNFYDSGQRQFVSLERAGIPKSIASAILKLTAFDPAQRPQTATDVANLLRESVLLAQEEPAY